MLISPRLQNSPYFCVFKTLTPRFTDFFTDFEKKTDCSQSKSALKNHIINLFIPQYSYLIAQSTLKMPHNFCFFITPNQKARQSEIKINRLLGISEKMAPTQGIGWMVICMKLSTQAVSSFHCVFTGAKYRKGLFCGNK